MTLCEIKGRIVLKGFPEGTFLFYVRTRLEKKVFDGRRENNQRGELKSQQISDGYTDKVKGEIGSSLKTHRKNQLFWKLI